NWNFDLAAATSGEIVILVNWTAVSNHLTTGVTAQSVAAVVAPKIYQSQNSQPALSELPIHLIGHSRGGGMVFEIARLLGLQGIEVEQVTALDPHPLTGSDPQGLPVPIGPGQTIDTPISIYENILFTDNYYQNIQYPTGTYLNGAYNRLWTSLPGGYHNETGYTYNILGTGYNFSDHLNIILAYHGTIDLATPVTNGQATMTSTERAWFNTYENSGEKSGFYYSRDIYGDKKSTNTPVAAADQIIDGYHNNPNLGGDGARQSLTWTSAVWPNIIAVEASDGTNILVPGNTYEIGDLSQITFQLPVRSYASGGVINIYLDDDRNPYNGKVFQANTTYSPTGSSIIVGNPYFQPTQLMDKNYYALIEITGGTNTRYIYAPYQFYRTCVVNIPDANFKTLLLANTSINTNGDGEIQCSEAAAYTGQINVGSQNISDLTGIEAFTNITHLICSNNSLSALNLSANTALTYLDCSFNLLTSLNVSSNTVLQNLNCYSNSITSLNVSGLTTLTDLNCGFNQLSTLDVLTNTALQWLICDNNLLIGLDISMNTSVVVLECQNNLLTDLNVKNGNNTNISGFDFDATNNPGLTCIQVDDVAYSTTNWTNIDAGASFSTDCSVGLNELSENTVSIFPNPVINELTITNLSENASIFIYDINSKLLINKFAKSEIEKIDLSSFEKGVYSIKVTDDNTTITRKLIKL
ncbi:MAG: T9SS type A sorting domain-containing protein, partial [Bacteroidetes bacterium]|nr:T9SS type A sorting domain-containing protein [Bacteroidota bacterium]